MMDTTAAKSTEELDAQLINTLREIDPHNYAYLFERCKSCNVNARHLRFFKKDHIRELIPKNELGILAEFEHLLNLWQISKGYSSFDTKMQLNRVNESKNLMIAKEKPQSLSNLNISTNKPQVQGNLIIAKEKPYILRNNQPVVVAKQPIQVEPVIKNVQASPDENKISKAKRMRFNEDDDEEFTLEKIIPELLMDLKFSYELNNCLSGQERRLLCRTIVDYFVSRNIKLSLDTLDDLTEQIAEHFPKEDKKSWFNRYDYDKRGRLLVRIQNARRIMARQTASKLATNSLSSSEEADDDDSKAIQAWLKSHKFENFSEIIDLWEDTMKYRCWQTKHLKDIQSMREFLNNWPSYKLETGHELLTMDFKYFYPQAMETFRTRWLSYKQNIEVFLAAELKDVYCIRLLEKYQLQKAIINEDARSCVLIYLVHAITKPLRHFKPVNGNQVYAITDSQHSMTRLIRHKAEIDKYTEPYPCIFVVGNSLLEVQECYVAFMDLCYKLSYENCLAVCVQIFTVLKVEDPQASQCFWEFIRGYLFNIAKDKEKSKAVTENMVNYLETAASSI